MLDGIVSLSRFRASEEAVVRVLSSLGAEVLEGRELRRGEEEEESRDEGGVEDGFFFGCKNLDSD